MPSNQTFAIFALLSLAFFSCKKEESLSNGDRLKSIRFQTNDSISYRSFQYDDQNRVTSILDSNNNGHRSSDLISYDAQGKLSQVTSSADFFTTVYTFEYDNTGRIIKKFDSNSQVSGLRDTYSYDAEGRVIADSIHDYWSPGIFGVTSYAYNNSGNVVETKTIEKSSGTVSMHKQCTFDNHPNPLYGKSVLVYLLDVGYNIPEGKNNLSKEVYDDGTIVKYKFEYFSNGLPKRCTISDNSDPGTYTYVDYFYE
jgi:YD repeat-containing protein